MSGVQICFSGLDGAGKSTQIELLMKDLRDAGHAPRYLWTRGGYTPLFNRLKSLLRRLSHGRAVPKSGSSQARTQALSRPAVRIAWLQIALLDLLWVYAGQVRWWLWQGKTVVCDRYLWDTLIDFRLNFPQVAIEQQFLWRLLVRLAPKPTAAFLMLVPVSESQRRSVLKGEPFPDSAETLAARREQYLALSARAGWHELDGQRPIADLAAEIRAGLPAALGVLRETVT